MLARRVASDMLNDMQTIVEHFVNGLAVYAWLIWFFDGTLRQWLVAATFPTAWLGETRRCSVACMSGTTFEEWLSLDATCWVSIRKLLSCPYCMTFHIAFWWAVMLQTASAFRCSPAEFFVGVCASSAIAMLIKKTVK